jgi:hypothetical protein
VVSMVFGSSMTFPFAALVDKAAVVCYAPRACTSVQL